MSLFAKKEVEESTAQKLERLNAEAVAIEPEALAKSDEIFAAAVAEHERQCAGFEFSCSRFGQFLTLNVRRNANPDERDNPYPWYQNQKRELAISINLNNVRSIEFIEGRAPDRQGELSYRVENTHDGMGRDWKRVVKPQYPYVPPGRAIFIDATPAPSSGDHGQMMGMAYAQQETQPNHKTTGFARPSVDDRIIFNGIYSTLTVPAGFGAKVYQTILGAE
jgi:hypothetical protein